MSINMSGSLKKDEVSTEVVSPGTGPLCSDSERKTLKHRVREIVWDNLGRSPEERKLIFKLDIFILYDFCSPIFP